jgi:hypothetical protein
MHIHTRLLAASFAFAALAVPGRASVPGNIPDLSYNGLVHVCEDVEPDDGADYIVCQEHEADDTFQPYTGSECVTAGLPAVCVTDFIPKVRLKGTILLVHDDDALDSGGTPVPQGQTAVILELKKGAKKRTFIELFAEAKIGNWNSFGGETFITGTGGIDFETTGEFQFANQNLTDLGLEVRDQAALWFPKADLSAALPVITAIARDTKKDPLDEDAFEEKLASAVSLRVEIQFARAIP